MASAYKPNDPQTDEQVSDVLCLVIDALIGQLIRTVDL